MLVVIVCLNKYDHSIHKEQMDQIIDYTPSATLSQCEWPTYIKAEIDAIPCFTKDYISKFKTYSEIMGKLYKSRNEHILILAADVVPIFCSVNDSFVLQNKSRFDKNTIINFEARLSRHNDEYPEMVEVRKQKLKQYVEDVHEPIVKECKQVEKKIRQLLENTLVKEEEYFTRREKLCIFPEISAQDKRLPETENLETAAKLEQLAKTPRKNLMCQAQHQRNIRRRDLNLDYFMRTVIFPQRRLNRVIEKHRKQQKSMYPNI